jgi:hypothetical protein
MVEEEEEGTKYAYRAENFPVRELHKKERETTKI